MVSQWGGPLSLPTPPVAPVAMVPCSCHGPLSMLSTHPRSLSRLPHHRPREAKRRARRQNGARLATSRTNLPFWVVWALESGNICPDEFVNTKSLQSPTRPLSTTQGFFSHIVLVPCQCRARCVSGCLVVWYGPTMLGFRPPGLIHLPSPTGPLCAPQGENRTRPQLILSDLSDKSATHKRERGGAQHTHGHAGRGRSSCLGANAHFWTTWYY